MRAPHHQHPRYGAVSIVDDHDREQGSSGPVGLSWRNDETPVVVSAWRRSLLGSNKRRSAAAVAALVALGLLAVVVAASTKTGWFILRGAGSIVATSSRGTTALSMLCPELDLGLPAVDRAEGADPSRAWGVRWNVGWKGRTKALARSGEGGGGGVENMEVLPKLDRDGGASPSEAWGDDLGKRQPLPTNSWYLNLLSHTASKRPSESSKAYTVPYIVDTAGPLSSGLRVHWPIVRADPRNVQMLYDVRNGLTVGTLDESVGKNGYVADGEEDLSLLGVSLRWKGETDKAGMVTHIVRGMPFATVRYIGGVLPSIASGNKPASSPLVDGETSMDCGALSSDGTVDNDDTGATATAKREVMLHFKNSDFTWIVLFSRPVTLRCSMAMDSAPGVIADVMFRLDVVDTEDDDDDKPLTVRTALVDQCTTGKSDIKAHCKEREKWTDHEGYLASLRGSAHLFPKTPKVEFEYPDEDETLSNDAEARMVFDWDQQSTELEDETSDEEDLLMFALPHHQDILEPFVGANSLSTKITEHCVSTFHGNTCLVKGNRWSLREKLGNPVSFEAKRPPEASAIAALAEAVKNDIKYRLSSNLMRGASDTYFSAKILARVSRVILIASELKRLAKFKPGDAVPTEYDVDEETYELSAEAAKKANLPSDNEIKLAVKDVKDGLTIWLNGKAEAPFVYDRSWGGLVNCGCAYVGKDQHGYCKNKFPDCPALEDVNVDFGNGYYNDHHFHYGYTVYAAAVVSKYDPKWGREYFDRVLLFVRDIANPSAEDESFTQFRHKDWFLGSSWASGIVSAENSPHGRNQESSSEAIAAYEAVGLYGAVMMDAFRSSNVNSDKIEVAKQIRDAGQLLTATEIRAANRYWHVWEDSDHDNTYPPEYKEPVVGMLYETMASFQTWFAPEDFVSFGIQLLPFTPAAEERDDPGWAAELYPLYGESCSEEETFCVDNGWSIMQQGLLATAGHRSEALEEVLKIPAEVFDSEGGVGHSLTNTIWYVATRKPVGLSVADVEV